MTQLDCEHPQENGRTARELTEVVAELRKAGATTVLVGVVGPGIGELRSVVPNVRALAAADDASLEDVSGAIFGVPGRCVVVARRGPEGWSWVVTGGGEPVGFAEVRPPDPEPVKQPPKGGFQAGVGVAAGRYLCVPHEVVDPEIHFAAAASPMGFVAVEFGAAPVYVFLGVDSAPTYQYSCSIQLSPLVMGTVGLWFGDDLARIGPYASLGLIASEVGVRAALTPWGEDPFHHGVEVRLASVGYPEQPLDGGSQLTVAWTAAWR